MNISNRGRRVLIRTQPLGHNYGGLLQAYALQQVIKALGHQVDTDLSRPIRGTLMKRATILVRRLGHRLLRGPDVRDLANRELIQFRDDHLSGVALYSRVGTCRRRAVRGYSAFLVGSDQVWRPRYSDVPSCLFDFLPTRVDSPVLSYAASFGSNEVSEYSPTLRSKTRPLAQRLDAISVRERSGVDQVLELWGREDAQHHVDPTLLLEPADYELLITPHPPAERQSVISYFLDESPGKRAVAHDIAVHLGLPLQSLTSLIPPSREAYRAEPDRFHKVSIGSWLKAMRDARFIVTDSFHGCIFAILFERPFVVVPNETRGATRFESLLDQFALNHCAISLTRARETPTDIHAICEIGDTINWQTVRNVLQAERCRSIRYLASGLA